MFLSKRNGIFYLWYEDKKGKRRKVSTRCTTKSDALQFLRKFTPSTTSSVTISSFASNLPAMLSREYVSGTLKIYKRSLQNLIKIAGNIQIRTLTAYHFDKYKLERLKSVKPVTVNIELRALKAGLEMALKWKMIELLVIISLIRRRNFLTILLPFILFVIPTMLLQIRLQFFTELPSVRHAAIGTYSIFVLPNFRYFILSSNHAQMSFDARTFLPTRMQPHQKRIISKSSLEFALRCATSLLHSNK